MINFTNTVILTSFECSSNIPKAPDYFNRKGPYCNSVHDGILCWPKTPAGQKVAQPCPPMLGFNEERFVYRKCSLDGIWEPFNESSVVIENTDYEACVKTDIFENNGETNYMVEVENVLRKTSILGMTFVVLSLIAILISVIMYKYVLPKYVNNVLLVKIHKHLFGAVTCEMTIKLIFQISIFLEINQHISTSIQRPVICEFLASLNQYFEITTLLWIVIDCHFIHITARSGLLCISGYRAYVIIGWGTPLIPTLIWVMTLIMSHKVACWQGHMTLTSIWIVEIPKTLCFLAIILLILLSSYRQYHKVSERLIQDTKVINSLTTIGIMFFLMLISFLVVIIPTHIRIADLQQKIAVQYLATILTCSKGIYLTILCNYSNIKDYLRPVPSDVDIEI